VRVGGLFEGIGGFGLGFEQAGMEVAWQVELDPYCRAVLAQHFPDAERFEDVRDVGAHNLAPVDVLCGGFPCQDLSVAGKGAGIDGARSGLWSEFARIIGELRPRYIVVENVPALTRNEWLGRVLGDLAACGYDAEWDCIPAAALGAPHRRDRVWLVAYPGSDQLREQPGGLGGSCGAGPPFAGVDGAKGNVANSPRDAEAGPAPSTGPGRERVGPGGPGSGAGDLRHAGGERSQGRGAPRPVGDADWWSVEPDVGRVADGVPSRVDRLAALGNALVPQIAEWIGRRIVLYEQENV
jgi:DNA (cytosine-5)-methyltransferase 1